MESLELSSELCRRFLTWSSARNTAEWVRCQRRYLAWWVDELGAVDLRRLQLSPILDALDASPACRAHKIAVLKRLYSWLRCVRHVVTPAQDPTLDTLQVPQSTPAQWRTSRVVPRRDLEAAIRQLSSRWRARLVVLAGTGWHVRELQRFATHGRTFDRRSTRGGLVLVCPRAKRGGELRTRVSLRCWRAALEVLAAGRFDDVKLRRKIHAACRRARVPDFGPGSLRHTVATFAVDAGAPLEAVASFLGHLSPRTTARFYATHAAPRRVPTPV